MMVTGVQTCALPIYFSICIIAAWSSLSRALVFTFTVVFSFAIFRFSCVYRWLKKTHSGLVKRMPISVNSWPTPSFFLISET